MRREGSARRIGVVVVCALLVIVAGCSGSSSIPPGTSSAPTAPGVPSAPSAPPPPSTPAPPPPPPPPHAGIVIFENQSFDTIVGNPAMPYLNGLIAQNGLATNYFANAHPSLPNYFMLTVGDVVTTTNDFSGTVSADNVVRQLVAAGKTWKVYAEGLPSPGYTGGDTGTYVKHHNPFAYLSDVLNDPNQAKNMVPMGQLAADISAGQLPNYFFIVPDNTHNSHDCPAGMSTCTLADKLGAADQWLNANIAPLLGSQPFQASGVLVVTFDESVFTDTTNGGGHIMTAMVGNGVKPGFRSTTFYQHQSTLRFTLQMLGISSYPGAAASAPDMKEFLK